MDPQRELELMLTRRTLFGKAAAGIGTAALASLLGEQALAGPAAKAVDKAVAASGGALKKLHFPAKAKRVIYLHQSGGPSHIDLFDWKPKLAEFKAQDLPASVRMGQRITGMTSGQKTLPVAPTIFKFAQHGKNGQWFSELLPHTAGIADDICILKAMHTEAINHDPAITFIQTGSQQPGRPSLGSWMSYGLGSDNQNLPAFIVLISLAATARMISRCSVGCGATDSCPPCTRA